MRAHIFTNLNERELLQSLYDKVLYSLLPVAFSPCYAVYDKLSLLSGDIKKALVDLINNPLVTSI